MGFDQNTRGQPLIHPEKKTTQVNFTVVLGVLIFLIAGAATTWWVLRNPPQSPDAASPASP